MTDDLIEFSDEEIEAIRQNTANRFRKESEFAEIKVHVDRPEWKKTTVKEYVGDGNGFYTTLAYLKTRIQEMEESGIPLDTPVAVEALGSEIFTQKEGFSGWEAIDFLWEAYPRGDVLEKQFSPCVIGFNFFLTNDIEGSRIVVLTPHY